jgi:two-component system, OmpR family, response regulator MprA
MAPVTVTLSSEVVRVGGAVELDDEPLPFDDEPQAVMAGVSVSAAIRTPKVIHRGARRDGTREVIGENLGVGGVGHAQGGTPNENRAANAAQMMTREGRREVRALRPGLTRRSPVAARKSAMGAHLVIAEDDRAVRESVTRALELEGYSVTAVSEGIAALEAASAPDVDLLLLDLGMPNIDGLTVCRRLRSAGSRLPILVLTARTEVSDRVSGLDAGADDYLPKPFSLDELLARLRALLRRTSAVEGDAPQKVTVDDLMIDAAARRAWRADRELELTKTEFDLLELLAINAGVVLSHSSIYDQIWGYDFGPDSKALAVYIGYLRRKTEESGEDRIIQTVRGVGYTLRSS